MEESELRVVVADALFDFWSWNRYLHSQSEGDPWERTEERLAEKFGKERANVIIDEILLPFITDASADLDAIFGYVSRSVACAVLDDSTEDGFITGE